MYAYPALFEFKPPVWDGGDGSLLIVAIAVLFLLTMALLSHGMKYRYLLNRFWDLMSPDREQGVNSPQPLGGSEKVCRAHTK